MRPGTAFDGKWWDYSLERVPPQGDQPGYLAVRCQTHYGEGLVVGKRHQSEGLAMFDAWNHFQEAWWDGPRKKLLPPGERPGFRFST